MKLNYKLILLYLFISAFANAQTINLRLSTYVYSWQRADSLNNDYKTTHLKSYQNLFLEVSKNKWSLNTSLLTQEDIVKKTSDGFEYSIYNLYIKGTDLWNALDVKIGRQYVFAGVGNGTMDGINLKLKTGKNKEYQISVYGGALTPGDYNFRKYPSLDNNFIFGSIFSYYGNKGLSASLSYYIKRKQYEPYTAPRTDSLFNTTDELIVTDSRDQHLAGFNLSYTGKQKYFIFGKAFYDIYRKKFYRAEFNASYPVKNFRISADYSYREPQLTYNTTFWTMAQYWTLNHYQQVGGGIDYTLRNGINIFGSLSDVIYTDDNSLKYQAGFKHPGYGLYYTGFSGYSGKSNGFTGYLFREIVRSVLSGNLTLNYSNYNIGELSSDKVNEFSGMIGITYRPSAYFTIDAQGQFITNRIYKIDSRFLIGINYRLFKVFK